MSTLDAPATPAGVSPLLFRDAMREFAAGVTVVAAGSGDGRRGLTATAVCSVSADPPTLLACVNRATDAHGAISATGRFSVNVLAADQRAVAERFAGRDGRRGVERFDDAAWAEAPGTGAPVLREAVAVFDCVVAGTLTAGTHTIFLGRVMDARVLPGRAALVYRAGAFSAVDATV